MTRIPSQKACAALAAALPRDFVAYVEGKVRCSPTDITCNDSRRRLKCEMLWPMSYKISPGTQSSSTTSMSSRRPPTFRIGKSCSDETSDRFSRHSRIEPRDFQTTSARLDLGLCARVGTEPTQFENFDLLSNSHKSLFREFLLSTAVRPYT